MIHGESMESTRGPWPLTDRYGSGKMIDPLCCSERVPFFPKQRNEHV